nr:hypothetical protein [Tanacetum cinerariifolium]
IPNQQFNKLHFEEEILAFLRELGHSGEIKMITDVNINKLYQPWRSFAAVTNKCLGGKSTGYDSLLLSQAQILWGMYHKKNVDFAYLLWEDFVYQVEHKDAKKSNEMYYPRFTKYSAILPVELTHKAIRNSKSYKEYYAIASGAEPSKTKVSVKKKQSSSDTTVPPSTAKGKRLKTPAKVDKPAKEKQPAKSSKAKGLTVLSEVALTKAKQIKLATKRSLTQTHISHAIGSGADEGTDDDDDEEKISKHDDDDDQSDDDDQDNDNDQDDDEIRRLIQIMTVMILYILNNDEDTHGMNVERDEGANEKDEANELYKDMNINLVGRDVQMVDVQTTQVIEDTHVSLTLVNLEGQQKSSSVSSLFVSNMLNPSPDTGIDSIFESTPNVDVLVMTTTELPLLSTTTLPLPYIPIISHVQQTPAPTPPNIPSSSLQDLPNFGSLLRDEAQVENEDFLNKLDENIPKIIKEQVKEQVKVQVSNILPKIKKTVNEQLEAEVLTRSSNSSKTSHVVVADLSKLELKKILIEKMESNKCQDNEDKDEEPSAGSNWGSKRRRAGKEPETTSTPKEKTSKTSGKSTKGSKSYHKTASESAPPWINNLAKKANSHTSFNELIDTPVDFSAFVMNRLKVDTLTPELLAGPTYLLMKGSCKSLVELEFFLEEVYKATTDQLDWNNPEGQQYPHDLLKPLPLIPNSRGRRIIPFDHFINNDLKYLRGGASSPTYTTSVTKTKESARDVYSKRRIIAVTELQIVKWHNYKHLDWITVCRDNDKLYKFKEGDFKKLRIQDIKDMLLLLVQGKLTNLMVDERFAFNISLQMFTRSIVIQRRVEDLQLGVRSYQKKLNLTKPDTYRSDLKRKEAHTTYSNPRGFTYQNKDKQNRLMRIDELHKFSNGTLNDVRTALDDCLKGI